MRIVRLREGPEGSGVEEVPLEVKTEVGPGMAIGAAVGAVGGALVAVAGLLATAPLVALLQGAVGGSAAGLFTGFVAGLGYWRDAADFPHARLPEGAVLVGVMADRADRIAVAKSTLEALGAKDVQVRSRRQARDEIRRQSKPTSPARFLGRSHR